MKRGSRPDLIWGLGLDENLSKALETALGSGYHLRNWPITALPSKRDMDKASPLTVWIPLSVWNVLPPSSRKHLRDWELTQRVLLLDGPQDGPDVEEILELGFLTALTPPITANKIRDAVFRAKEVRGLYDDIFSMTREIMLERELLARKTDQIIFLNTVLARASQSLEPGTILSNAREDLSLLFPIHGLQGVFWQPGENGKLEAELFLAPCLDQHGRQSWIEYLLGSATKLAGGPVDAFTVEHLFQVSPDSCMPEPGAQTAMLLPLKIAGSAFGCLSIAKDKNLRLGKDQVTSLNAAANHLALALRNALLFREIKAKADHDGLTRIHNRQSFDERLADELKRHQRYRHSLSLLLFDLDHFKAINDTYGHQAGDMVLKDVGAIMDDSCRETDFAARFGGEEFVVILPQTTEDQAWVLAERLRRKIEHATFNYADKNFQVTASIGVATLSPGSLDKREDLIRQADQALYLAKSNGRNMVCASQAKEQKKAVAKARLA
ncbi:GGDEF domain-containing protein [Fundidesulfovibrio terrae]|uniref:GGDEF domain-containing protein n=1 Tax=Fundidesulfovibrio terrae TaxID=2922866 RepID=UPI001FAED033|nr:GGDEF domain-containing protein [Fundidesulfovibrio terrae]